MTQIEAPDDLADRYTRDGYAIVPGAFTPAEVAQLRAEALRICRSRARLWWARLPA
jgi:hypothetical protein